MASRSRIRLSTDRSSLMSAGTAPWDEMINPQGGVRRAWKKLSNRLDQWSAEDRAALSANAARMLADLGTTFNVFSDAGGAEQPYEIDPVPLMISAADWERVSEGMEQRMRLLDAVMADLYGPQTLLRDGLVSPDLLHANPGFLPCVRGVSPVGGRHLVTMGCDLVRLPDGAWTVLRDHTRHPGGLGQALENRSVTANLLSDVFDAERVAPLGRFFELEKETLRSLAPPRGEMPNVVVLTPGFRHPSYFEHACKARLLGFPLVEPADLTVRERRLFLKTLSGLRRIDGLACRLDDDGIDPLEFWTHGGGGVPGLFEAWRSGNVALANAPGTGFASSPALMPFLPAVCRAWFGEELKLPFVETWWLGQPGVRRWVLDELHRFILLPAFRGDPLLPLRCSSLSAAARRQWIATIQARPHDFVVQRDVSPSTAPAIGQRGARSKPVVWRAFALNAADGPVVLPGGLARTGKSAVPPQMWPVHAGYTKDVWVPDLQPGGEESAELSVHKPHTHAPAAAEVPSRMAEQLYWVGRYAERVELKTRLLRVTLRRLSSEFGRGQRVQLDACLSLITGSGLLPPQTRIIPSLALETLASLVHDANIPSGLVSLTRSLLFNAASARDRLSDDTWRFINRLEGIVHPPAQPPRLSALLDTLDTLVLHIAAFGGMQAENMTRGQGWRFLETGRRIERTLGALALLQSVAATEPQDAAPVLDPLLETFDSVMTYRRRHFSRPRWSEVLPLLFSERSNPRSVAYQIGVMHAEATRFPGDQTAGLFPRIREVVDALNFRALDPSLPDAVELGEMTRSVEELSDLLTQHYFSHSVRRVF